MEKTTRKVVLACVAVVSLCASSATFAQGGGNGNGGSGGGGAHGAATAGMTYHSEPVSSPWNARPGKMPKNTGSTDTGMHSMSPDDDVMPVKTGQ
ncbi:hypothetical protein OKW30_002842 [Paraburkholderia sp. Clong3]